MRDVPCSRGLMPGGSMEEAGKGGGPGQTRPLSRGSSEVSVELELSTPLRRKKGRTDKDLLENFSIVRWMAVYFYSCGGGVVLQCKQRNIIPSQ